MLEVGLAASFGAGILSFLSPCILPLVPSYLVFLTGVSLQSLTDRSANAVPLRAGSRAVTFVLGFSVVFVALGASASLLGQFVSDHLTLLSGVAGAVIVLLGLHMLGVFRLLPLMREMRIEPSRPAGLAGAFIVGLAFGFGWTPCVGPVLTSILLLAGTQDTVAWGASLLAAYAAGLGVPFIAAALFVGPFLRWLSRFRRHLGVIERAMGVILVVTGILIMTGSMLTVGIWLLENVPILGRIG